MRFPWGGGGGGGIVECFLVVDITHKGIEIWSWYCSTVIVHNLTDHNLQNLSSELLVSEQRTSIGSTFVVYVYDVAICVALF